MTRKRLLDLTLLLPLVPLFAAVTGLLALAVLLADGRPVFFHQPRVGQGQRPFTVWKLRTMTTEPDPRDRTPTRLGAWLHRQHTVLVAGILIVIGLLVAYKGLSHL